MLTVIEINDAALRVSQDGRVVCDSPAIALVQAQRVLAGTEARTRARLHPRAVHDRFWQHLHELPLTQPSPSARHHADLAYHHLRAVLAAAGRPAEAVFAIATPYSDEQLALALGIAAAAGVKVIGLVDSSVAALAGCAPPGRYVVADIHQHRVTLSRVVVTETVTRTVIETLEHAGLHRVQAAAVSVVAAALLAQARFDALREAETEQLLYDYVPQWLSRACDGGELRVAIEHRGSRFSARIAAAEFEPATATALAGVTALAQAHGQLLVTAALAALPGSLALLAPVAVLPAEACYRGIAEHRAAFAARAGGVAFSLRLPATAAPAWTGADHVAQRGRPARPVTHILAGHQANPLGAAPVYLHRDGSLAAHASDGDSCSITLEATRALLRVDGAEARVNGEVVHGLRQLAVGDHITLAGGRALFIPIVVTDPGAP